MTMKNLLLALAMLPCWVQAQTLPWSQRMTATIMATYPDSMVTKGGRMAHWDYEMGLMMHAVEAVWHRTGNARYYNYMLKSMDQMVNEDGSIKNYDASKFNIDFIAPGRSLLLLSQLSLPKKEKYRKAADLLRKQLADQPRTKEGGFWHKQTYPNQMWLDGLYMA
ncbi:MAG: glycoside hydrolase family 88 protein, partial [Cytophagaceae bacterium]